MKLKDIDPRNLALDLTSRSICQVQVAAVLSDQFGIFSWGWNHSGADGFGEHAEAMAIRRANPERLEDSTISVAAVRGVNIVFSKPCEICYRLIMNKRIYQINYRIKTGTWTKIYPKYKDMRQYGIDY